MPNPSVKVFPILGPYPLNGLGARISLSCVLTFDFLFDLEAKSLVNLSFANLAPLLPTWWSACFPIS